MKTAIRLWAIAGLFVLGCAHSPTTPGARADLTTAAQQTLQEMQAKDPSLRSVIESSVGYVVFPAVGEGGFIVGGGGGNGVVFENGKATGFAELRQASVGAVAGGRKYSELVVVRDRAAFDALKANKFDFGAEASAVMLRTGAAAGTTFENGVAVFMEPLKGAMVSASLTGQRIRMNL